MQIREIRSDWGISVERLAAEAGTTPECIRQVESGELTPPSGWIRGVMRAIGCIVGDRSDDHASERVA